MNQTSLEVEASIGSREQGRGPSKQGIGVSRKLLQNWYESQSWRPYAFQKHVWKSYLDGDSGLLHSATGSGKTLSVWLGPVIEWLAEQVDVLQLNDESFRELRTQRDRTEQLSTWLNRLPSIETLKEQRRTSRSRQLVEPIRVLWLTPLRALATDTAHSLNDPIQALNLPWTIETRTGDTASHIKQRQNKQLPTALVTTPESLMLLLSQRDAKARFRSLRCIIVDEWHELLGSKRGLQTELALARLRNWFPRIRTWGLSATLGNIGDAAETLMGSPNNDDASNDCETQPLPKRRRHFQIIEGSKAKRYEVETLIPKTMERFPWAGHLGLKLLKDVIERIEKSQSCLVFTNTRSQTESWYQAILHSRPDWAGIIALHHGSLDRSNRDWVENQLRAGKLKCVVCTSTLDLGVDFSPVELVIQIGSPKGIARLIQRAGRSGHSLGRTSRVLCVPTHALELIEFAAARNAMRAGVMEQRAQQSVALDVLIQHAVTIATAEGFQPESLFDEVKMATSYQDLDRKTWDWILGFITTGGDALKAYPDYQRVTVEENNLYRVTDPKKVRQHRMSMGTIVSDGMLTVQFMKGRRLGQIEESFLAKLNPGDTFIFGGKLVLLVRIHESTVWVRAAKSKSNAKIPRWLGGRMPLSTELADAVRDCLDQAAQGVFQENELQANRELLELQHAWSAVPRKEEFLIEQIKTREGHHTFFYPFAGRLVHEGLAALFAFRFAQREPTTFSMSVNDYGFELLSQNKPSLLPNVIRDLLSLEKLEEDIQQCLNQSELAKRQFREIAAISGLVFTGYPGSRKTAKQLQASSGLLFDVFREYDAGNPLLWQAHQEVLEKHLEHQRLVKTLIRLQEQALLTKQPQRLTPLCFPLLVDRMRARLSSETLANRIERMLKSLEKAAN